MTKPRHNERRYKSGGLSVFCIGNGADEMPTFKSRKKISRPIPQRIATYPGGLADALCELPVGVALAADALGQCGDHEFVQIAV